MVQKHLNSLFQSGYVSVPTILIPVALSAFLILVSFTTSFVLFHTMAELFAIVIAILMAVVAWQMYPFSRNNFLMFLGAGYFWVGILDLVHAMSYKGMAIMPNNSETMSTQFWIATRYLESLVLLAAPWFLTHTLHRRRIFSFFAVIATLIIYLVLYTDVFPVTYIPGKGLTTFKVVSEYIIIAILLVAIIYLKKSEKYLDKNIVTVMIVSIALTMGAELAFTFYIDVYGFSNLVGHIFKLFSYWLIFMAMVKTTLKDPFRVMSRTATTYDAIPDATIVVDENGVIYQANRAASVLAGVDQAELVGLTDHELFHNKNISIENCPVCQAIRNNQQLSSLELHIAAREKWLEFSLSHIVGASGLGGTVEVIRDITERKVTEKKLSELDVMKNSIVENLPNMLFVKDAEDHRFLEWNRAAEELTGMLKEDVLGRTDFDFFPEEQARFFTEKDNEVIRSGQLQEVEKEPLKTRFKGTRMLHTKKVPIYNEQGKPRYLLGFSEDITDRLKTEEMLRRSQKMEAVGQMSGGIAHDFNNQLGVILGYAELLSEQPLTEQQLKWIEAVQLAANRCADLTRQLLIFSREMDSDSKALSINSLVEELKLMIQRSLTPQVNVEYYLDENLWQTKVNGGDFKDAVLNLVLNARDAMPSGGTITIETCNSVLDESSVASMPDIEPGQYVQIRVSDTGQGMEEEIYEHIFEPFFTTKGVGEGTGLGLSMVYGFVHRYKGDISVQTSKGMGTSFRIYLPRAVDETRKIEADSSEDEVFPGGDETILVVDDEAALLVFAEQILRSWGYQVYTASNGRDALNLLENNEIDLLFTDVVMPGDLNGYELALRAQRIRPELKVLVTSGYAEKFSNQEEYADLECELVSKPYDRMQLARRIRQLLDR